MSETDVIEAQRKFYRRYGAGCSFAAYAARSPRKYGWSQKVINPTFAEVESSTQAAIADQSTSMTSLIFPTISTATELVKLVDLLQGCTGIHLGQNTEYKGARCLGLRVRVGSLESWVSGFGPFDFLPVTRRSPYTEIAFRVKARPNYELIMKPAPENVIHLADLDLLGITNAAFRTLWQASLDRTARLLGHTPDLRSAAKTTYAIPKEIVDAAGVSW